MKKKVVLFYLMLFALMKSINAQSWDYVNITDSPTLQHQKACLDEIDNTYVTVTKAGSSVPVERFIYTYDAQGDLMDEEDISNLLMFNSSGGFVGNYKGVIQYHDSKIYISGQSVGSNSNPKIISRDTSIGATSATWEEIPSTGYGRFEDIKVKDNNLYALGNGSGVFDFGSIAININGSFIAKYTIAPKQLLWVKKIDRGIGQSIEIDEMNNVFVTGDHTATNNITVYDGSQAYTLGNPNTAENFLIKFDDNGDYSNSFGYKSTTTNDKAFDMVTDIEYVYWAVHNKILAYDISNGAIEWIKDIIEKRPLDININTCGDLYITGTDSSVNKNSCSYNFFAVGMNNLGSTIWESDAVSCKSYGSQIMLNSNNEQIIIGSYSSNGSNEDLVIDSNYSSSTSKGYFISRYDDSIVNSCCKTEVDLGEDIVACEGDEIGVISIVNQGFNSPNFNITWYYNGNEVQVGGETLLSSYNSGTITVIVSSPDCKNISDSIEINIQPCCTEILNLAVDCENQLVYIDTYLPTTVEIATNWTFNNSIVPQSSYSSSLSTSYGSGTYSVSVSYALPNGELCNLHASIVYKAEDCCAITGAITSVEFVNVEYYETVETESYGEVQVPVLCDFTIDASASSCEESYYLSISEIIPETWFTTTVFGGLITQAQAPSNLDLGQFYAFQPHKYYQLHFMAQPNGNSEYLIFKYGLDAEGILTSINSYETISTKHGEQTIPVVDCRLILDGSASLCEENYKVRVDKFIPSLWQFNGNVYNGNWTTGPVPNSLNLTSAYSQLDNGEYYMLTLVVDPIWNSHYILFKKEECEFKNNFKLHPNPSNGIFNIFLGKEETGKIEVHDIYGSRVYSKVFKDSKTIVVDIEKQRKGVYFVNVIIGTQTITKKIIKQ